MTERALAGFFFLYSHGHLAVLLLAMQTHARVYVSDLVEWACRLMYFCCCVCLLCQSTSLLCQS